MLLLRSESDVRTDRREGAMDAVQAWCVERRMERGESLLGAIRTR